MYQDKSVDIKEVRSFLPHSGQPYFMNASSFPTIKQERSKTLFRSQDNPLWPLRKSAKHFPPELIRMFQTIDIGNHLFRKEQIWRTPSQLNTQIARVVGPISYRYTGAVCVGMGMSTFSSLLTSGLTWPTFEDSDISLWGRGAAVINATLPNKEQMNIATSLAELRREGLPTFLNLRQILRNPGGAYLNVAFGWEPIIRDVQSLAQILPKTADLIRKFEAMRGNEYRRRRNVVQEASHDAYTYPALIGAYPPSANLYTGTPGAAAQPLVTRRLTDHIWFSGCYRVATLDDSTLLGKIEQWEQQANHLLGIRITPETLYNLTAWTWLLDWFVTVGDVISNYSHLGRDGVTLKYGYLMRTTTVDARVSLPGVLANGKEVNDRVTLTRKSRVRATPYGFGLTAADLNPKQWAILGALGLSKAQGVLW